MKDHKTLIILCAFILNVTAVQAQDKTEIITVYKGSEVEFDDEIGFEKHHILVNDTLVEVVEGKIRRQFCYAPADRSAYEIVKNFEKAILSKGGNIINITDKAGTIEIDRQDFIQDLFVKERISRYNPYAYLQLPNYANDYVAGKIATEKFDIYITLAAVKIEDDVVYTLVTVESKPMDMNMVTLNILNDGIASKGKVAIYNIYFDTGKYEVKPESSKALKVIAGYLNKNTNKKFLIVGHTDNTGNFESNIELSKNRANAVIEKLVSEYGVTKNQLKPYGIGSASPKMSNLSEDGRARNRRVELVEL